MLVSIFANEVSLSFRAKIMSLSFPEGLNITFLQWRTFFSHLFAHSFVPMAKNFIAFEKANIKCDNKQNSHEIIQNVETDTYFVCPEQSGHNKFYIEYLMKSLTLLWSIYTIF